MKYIFLIAALILTQVGFSQTAKEVGEFTSLKVYDKISVTLIPSKQFKVELSGSESEHVEIINKNGELRVRMAVKKSLQGEDVKAKVYYKTLDAIEVNEGASVASDAKITDIALKINVKTGGKVDLEVEVERLNVKAHTGGVSKISGKAKVQDIIANSGAAVYHRSLTSNQTDVTVNAGGIAEVMATALVEAKTRAGGNITIYGEPTVINEKIIAGGSIKKVKK